MKKLPLTFRDYNELPELISKPLFALHFHVVELLDEDIEQIVYKEKDVLRLLNILIKEMNSKK
jgi:hypothetical protein